MADIDVPVDYVTIDGVELEEYTSSTTTALSTSDNFKIPNNGRVVLLIDKGSGAVDVTIETPGNVGGNAIADRVVDCSASEKTLIGPFPVSIYGSELDVTFSSVTNLELSVIGLG